MFDVCSTNIGQGQINFLLDLGFVKTRQLLRLLLNGCLKGLLKCSRMGWGWVWALLMTPVTVGGALGSGDICPTIKKWGFFYFFFLIIQFCFQAFQTQNRYRKVRNHAYTKHRQTYWCPCNSRVRPLRPPMSHMMMLWSEAPEKSSLWTGSHHRAPILPE